uniref:EH domain-containing protein n=1 Tax=Eptatretus burgeri TaxID=7764 RepID=A0A8C4NKJ3_EPTBU
PRPGVAAPVLGHPAWSVSSLRCSPPGCAGSRHTAGTTERTGLPALSQRGCSVWGGIADALSARRCPLSQSIQHLPHTLLGMLQKEPFQLGCSMTTCCLVVCVCVRACVRAVRACVYSLAHIVTLPHSLFCSYFCLYFFHLKLGVYRHVLESTMSPKGIDTTRLYPLLLSSGLPRETLGVIWSLANRAMPGQLARSELFAILALIAVAQSGLPVVSLECLAQYPTPPVPALNFPASNQSLSTSSPAHVEPISTVLAPPTISYSPSEPTTTLSAPFIIAQAKVGNSIGDVFFLLLNECDVTRNHFRDVCISQISENVLMKPPVIPLASHFISTSRDDCLSVHSLELPTAENAGTSRDDSDDGLSVASAPVRAASGLRRNNFPRDDSSSVRSLELPPPGGINVRDDWDEAGSLTSSGLRAASSVADLQHVLSDSSLDLPPVGQHLCCHRQGAPGLTENLETDLLEECESGTESRPVRFDFPLMGQLKVRSSEEMIISELETFDLSVGRGAWKAFIRYVFVERSLHLVVAHAASQQRFLTNGNFLHVKNLCIPDCRSLQVIKKANDIFNGITSSAVCTEVVQSEQGMEYLAGVVEVYRVSRRVEQGIKTAAVGSQVLQQSLRDIDLAWHNLITSATTFLDEKTLDFSTSVLKPGTKATKKLACGVCLLNVEMPEKVCLSIPSSQLTYGCHNYHASCANFWINCVEPKPPGLKLPELL